MKKILFPAICAMCVCPALAINVQPYIGVNLGGAYIAWNDDVKETMDDIDVKLSEFNIGIGAEAGVKFAPQKFWNGAIVVSYDYLLDAAADVDNPNVDKITSGFSSIGIGFDNYLRLGHAQKRNDLILGVGLAQITERIEFKSDFYNDSASDSGGAVMFKIGFNKQLTENSDWYVTTKVLVPFDDKDDDKEPDMDAVVFVSGGFKLHF